MDVLRNLFGNLTAGIIRLVVAVGILAAAYLFIVRPVLDTTNNAIDSANRSFGEGGISRQIQRSIDQANRHVQHAVNRSLRQTQAAPNQRRQTRLLRCVQRAHGNVNRMQRCARRF